MATDKKLQNTEQPIRKLPDTEQNKRDIPQTGSPENTILIGGRLIEIKPTKLRYQRN